MKNQKLKSTTLTLLPISREHTSKDYHGPLPLQLRYSMLYFSKSSNSCQRKKNMQVWPTQMSQWPLNWHSSDLLTLPWSSLSPITMIRTNGLTKVASSPTFQTSFCLWSSTHHSTIYSITGISSIEPWHVGKRLRVMSARWHKNRLIACMRVQDSMLKMLYLNTSTWLSHASFLLQ